MMDDNSTPKKWIVGIQQHRSAPGRTMGKLVKLIDPGTGEMRDYASMSSMDGNDKYIAEFQTMSESFSSFIVGRHIVKDGDLYLINRIDPLFFYLATEATSSTTAQQNANGQKQSWQPYEQFLEQSKLPREVTECISEEQIQHLCTTFDNEELYFKFNADKALSWLQKKQKRLFESLVRQDERRQKESKTRNSKGVSSDDRLGGSVSANFNFGSTASPPAPSKPTSTASPSKEDNSESLKMESFQIICNYLNHEWSKKFMEHMGVSMEEVTSSGTKQTRTSSVVSPDIQAGKYPAKNQENENKKASSANQKKLAALSRTVGNKRLAKVNTKGMRSIGSFFGAPKAKKPKV